MARKAATAPRGERPKRVPVHGFTTNRDYNDALSIDDEHAAMEAEHLNAIGNALAGLKDRTAKLRRYL